MPNKERQGKWQPFDALEGFRKALSETEKRLEKAVKPQIMDDAANEFNHVLKNAVENKKSVDIIYHHEGYTYDVSGMISHVNTREKTIKINNIIIKLNSIARIKLSEQNDTEAK